MECSLRRHLDSVGPDTPIWDIVDSCRVWESHAEDTDSWGGRHEPEHPRVVYQVVDDSKPTVASEDYSYSACWEQCVLYSQWCRSALV